MTLFLKLILFILIFFLSGYPICAQSTVNDFPSPGTNFIMGKIQVYPRQKIGIRDLGNQSWDLSAFLPENFDTIRLMEPLKTRYGRRFPDANIAMVSSPVQIEYLAIDSGSIYLTGLVDDFMEKKLPVLLRFQDRLLYKNPHLAIDEHYSDTSSTTFLSPYYSHPATDSIRADINYIRTGRVDASGKLITPTGKFDTEREVIFIEKIVKGYKYSVFGWTPAPEYSLNKHYTIYRWYTKELNLPIAEAVLNEEDYIEYIRYQYDSPMRLSFTGENVSCKDGSDGSIQLTVKGGIPDYTYEWTNGANTRDLSNLLAGTYGIVVTDNRGRKISSFYTVTEPQFSLKANLVVKHVSCRGMKDGSIKLSLSGGTAPYDFKWSIDSINETISNLGPGKIYLRAVDAGGCFIYDSVEIVQPLEKLSVGFETKHVSCHNGNDGSALVIPSGGTGPYRFLWADGDTSSFKQYLGPGQYELIIYDINNCTSKGKVIIKQPDSPVKISSLVKPVSCHAGSDGSIDLNVSGGKGPYRYLWSDSTDQKNRKGIESAYYHYLVIDNNNCEIQDSVFVPQPMSPLSVSFQKKNVGCFGESSGEIKAIVSGGTKDYSFAWSDGANKPELIKLKAGNYSLKVTDKNQCSITETVEILEPEKPLFADFEKFDVKCHQGNDGSIILTPEGGTPDYTYQWSNKSNQKDLQNIKAGKYSVIISDRNNCRLKKDFEIVQPDKSIEIDIQKKDADCHGAKTGTIHLQVKGGKPGYDFEWSNGATTPNILGIGAAKYTVWITDANLCKTTRIIEILEPEKLEIHSVSKNPEKDMDNGSIKIEISGGTKPYSILWDDGRTSDMADKLKNGPHDVQVTDARDCRISKTIVLE
jgi:hypothetical protein